MSEKCVKRPWPRHELKLKILQHRLLNYHWVKMKEMVEIKSKFLNFSIIAWSFWSIEYHNALHCKFGISAGADDWFHTHSCAETFSNIPHILNYEFLLNLRNSDGRADGQMNNFRKAFFWKSVIYFMIQCILLENCNLISWIC